MNWEQITKNKNFISDLGSKATIMQNNNASPKISRYAVWKVVEGCHLLWVPVSEKIDVVPRVETKLFFLKSLKKYKIQYRYIVDNKKSTSTWSDLPEARYTNIYYRDLLKKFEGLSNNETIDLTAIFDISLSSELIKKASDNNEKIPVPLTGKHQVVEVGDNLKILKQKYKIEDSLVLTL